MDGKQQDLTLTVLQYLLIVSTMLTLTLYLLFLLIVLTI